MASYIDSSTDITTQIIIYIMKTVENYDICLL